MILIVSMINPTLKAAKPYNVKVVLSVDWDLEETQKPIIPRDEIKELDLVAKFSIAADNYMGKGALIYYLASPYTALIDIGIVETSPGCSAVLRQTRFEIDILEYSETKVKLYLCLDDTIPAFSDGYVIINLTCPKLGLIEGFYDEFKLSFTPAYIPIIKTNLPEANTKRIKPTDKAVFPIEIENAGNARTEVTFEIDNVPEGWGVAIDPKVVLEEAKGSKVTAYLTVIPPDQFGYHYEEAKIRVKMTPAMVENPDEVGNPLYATFTVQNRGSSSSGIEQILFFVGIIFILLLVVIVFILKWMRKGKEKTVS